jgi:hypothetical protein
MSEILFVKFTIRIGERISRYTTLVDFDSKTINNSLDIEKVILDKIKTSKLCDVLDVLYEVDDKNIYLDDVTRIK